MKRSCVVTLQLWPGALIMAELLGRQDLSGRGVVVELGAGCGLLSMVAHARGRAICFYDIYMFYSSLSFLAFALL
jgi:hypothetical protein